MTGDTDTDADVDPDPPADASTVEPPTDAEDLVDGIKEIVGEADPDIGADE